MSVYSDPACEVVDAVVEEIAAGEHEPDRTVADHLASCPRCAAALSLARRVESALAARPQPPPPPDFARSILARVRTERWQEEERFDRAFNVGLGLAGALIALGVLAAFNLSGLGAVLSDATSIVAQGATLAADRMSIRPPLVVAIVLLLMGALLAWWWSEDRYSW